MPAVSRLACREVARDIFQVRLPLPFALNHVNCYLLRDEDGWTVIDTALNYEPAIAGWRAALAELSISPRAIRRVILTHMHPDHFGLCGWFQAQSGAAVYLSPRERDLAEYTWLHDIPTEEHRTAVLRYLHSGGISPEISAFIGKQQDRLRELTLPHPARLCTIEAGATVKMGGRTFQAIHAPGHADGQLLFYAAEDRLLLCGDQVLLHITPNIGMWPTSEPNPLGRYLRSLDQLARLDVALALPGHHDLITNWQERIGELVVHHEERLDAMYEAARAGATALDVSRMVFNFSKFSPHEVRFAVAETLAHLEYLAEAGVLVRVEERERRLYRAA
ncbi:MAG: MBL fold metallo-hydrolase [Caldilineaceae bacterium]|nr:MBL fold metallo-hydrolase [Caldilineaceae bacterium]